MIKYFLAALAAFTLAAPAVAQAQDVPSYASGGQTAADGEENLHGRIATFDGAYTLTVRDERGFIDNVQLHQGTIINPTGLTLEPGMVVSILGYNAGPYLEANEIDTPYTFYGGVPCYDGQIWSYWGPSVSLAFFFGNVGWWHGGYFGGPFGWRGGIRIYANAGYRPVPRFGYGYGYGYRENGYRGSYGYRAPSAAYRGEGYRGAGDRPSYARGDAERYGANANRGDDGRSGYSGGYRGAYSGETHGSYGGATYRGGSGGYRGGSSGYRGGSGGGHASASHSSGGGGHHR